MDVGPAAGFDIYSTLFRGVTIANRAYAVLNVNGEYCFYRINLLTGAATYVGSFKDVVVDIAIPLDQ